LYKNSTTDNLRKPLQRTTTHIAEQPIKDDNNCDCKSLWDLDQLIGYINFLGVFRIDPDPDGTCGYLSEDLREVNLLDKLVNINYIKTWEKNIAISYRFIKDIIDPNNTDDFNLDHR